ncbi:amidase signature domain-containing protein [Podospora conica]|nr:amidase signature domain-containing protein [Schizothecium conicum]
MTRTLLYDILQTDAAELQALQAAGKLTAVDLVKACFDQIERFNHRGPKLNAIINTVPRNIALGTAKVLDDERSQGKVRGPFHGIPMTVKDNIMTGPEFGLPTTVGSVALKTAMAKKNAPIVDMLVKAGVVIIGKDNLSEMAGWKGFGITAGWSAVGGQTQSPYVIDGVVPGEKLLGHSTPAGSSSGSAVSVAAGFAPLALATETDGSVVQPANRAALYGLKATVGLIPTEGTAPWSALTDSIGAMARTPGDLANVMAVLTGRTKLGADFVRTETWAGLRVGFVDPTLWNFVPFICDPDYVLIEQQHRALSKAVDVIYANGGRVQENVPLTSMDELVLDGKDALDQLWNHDYEREMNKFLALYKETPVRTLAELVKYNREHASEALPPQFPNQELLESALNDTLPPSKYAKGVKILRQAARIDKTLASYDLDVIIGPMDGRIPTIAAAAGCPVGTMPLGYSATNGRAFGACVVASAHGEAKILRAMSAWHATMPARKPPPMLVEYNMGENSVPAWRDAPSQVIQAGDREDSTPVSWHKPEPSQLDVIDEEKPQKGKRSRGGLLSCFIPGWKILRAKMRKMWRSL